MSARGLGTEPIAFGHYPTPAHMPDAVRWAAERDLSEIGDRDPWTEARAIVVEARGVAIHTLIAALGDRIMHYRQSKKEAT